MAEIGLDIPSLINVAPATALAVLCLLELKALRPILMDLAQTMEGIRERLRVGDTGPVRRQTPPRGVRIHRGGSNHDGGDDNG